MLEHAQTKGLDPALLNGVMGIIRCVSRLVTIDNEMIPQVCRRRRRQ